MQSKSPRRRERIFSEDILGELYISSQDLVYLMFPEARDREIDAFILVSG
jgi:hypothetical protein